MAKRSRRKFTAEFKASTVTLLRKGEKNIGEVAKELAVLETIGSLNRVWAVCQQQEATAWTRGLSGCRRSLTMRADGRVEYQFRRPDPSGRTSWVTDGPTWCRRLATLIPPRRKVVAPRRRRR